MQAQPTPTPIPSPLSILDASNITKQLSNRPINDQRHGREYRWEWNSQLISNCIETRLSNASYQFSAAHWHHSFDFDASFRSRGKIAELKSKCEIVEIIFNWKAGRRVTGRRSRSGKEGIATFQVEWTIHRHRHRQPSIEQIIIMRADGLRLHCVCLAKIKVSGQQHSRNIHNSLAKNKK